MPSGTLHWRSHFICYKATSFVYVRFSDNEVDSKLSNEVLASLVMKLCPADINEKSTCRNKSIFGCGTRIRTQTNRVRVCCATLTQFRNEQEILYTSPMLLSIVFLNFFRIFSNFFKAKSLPQTLLYPRQRLNLIMHRKFPLTAQNEYCLQEVSVQQNMLLY